MGIIELSSEVTKDFLDRCITRNEVKEAEAIKYEVRLYMI